ncbi:FecCD family ABC transporter permease [Thalassotalea atypica]|uniref:FecCD family ABC transporter permease n=1 Tax=Thalassotalea atypica TaxID=2054316 RepID=UPI002573A3D8|nr:iron ABC transporter permease [Thalassotalea atypica]
MTKLTVALPLLLILSALSLVASLTFGSVPLSLGEITSCLIGQCENTVNQVVIWELRVPRLLVGFVAGAGLSCAGAMLQNTTRNNLADPYIFGIVAGAGLGATIAHVLLANYISIALPLGAFIGALISIIIVVLVAKSLKRIDQVLLTGIAISFMFSAATQFLLYMSEPFATNRIMFWLMGSLANVSMPDFYLIFIVVSLCITIMLALHRQIDALLLGESSAQSLGVNTNNIRLLMFGLCAAITATIVAYCGGIGFVGLMVPHIVRKIIGVTLVPLLVGSTLVGGIFLVWVDVIARSAMNEVEIPIGIITSALGSVFFILIMSKRIK